MVTHPSDQSNADNCNANNCNADNGNADKSNADNDNADNSNADNGNADNDNPSESNTGACNAIKVFLTGKTWTILGAVALSAMISALIFFFVMTNTSWKKESNASTGISVPEPLFVSESCKYFCSDTWTSNSPNLTTINKRALFDTVFSIKIERTNYTAGATKVGIEIGTKNPNINERFTTQFYTSFKRDIMTPEQYCEQVGYYAFYTRYFNTPSYDQTYTRTLYYQKWDTSKEMSVRERIIDINGPFTISKFVNATMQKKLLSSCNINGVVYLLTPPPRLPPSNLRRRF